MKYFFLAFAAAVLAVALIAGPRGYKSANRPFEFFPDMDRQPKVKAQVDSVFFADGTTAATGCRITYLATAASG